MKRGLTLGKFAPLHRGHQFLIETALAEVDELSLIIYDSPDVTPIPLPIRANWIRQLYPQVQMIEAWGGSSEVGNSPQIQKLHEDYILNVLQIREISHFYSSEFYGEHMSKALGAVNRLVDPTRQQIPISASRIRVNPFQYRHFLHPVVYRDLITKVVFLGAPSTGKSSIAEALAKQYQTHWMPEYGREYWEAQQINRRLSLEQLVEIAEGHLEREELKVQEANRYLFVDTNAITTYMFSQAYHGQALARLQDLAKQASSRYDLVFVCDTDIPYADTWDRSGDVQRQVFQKQILSDLQIRRIPYFLLRGNLETRINYVIRILEKYQPYQNLADLFAIEDL